MEILELFVIEKKDRVIRWKCLKFCERYCERMLTFRFCVCVCVYVFVNIVRIGSLAVRTENLEVRLDAQIVYLPLEIKRDRV